MTEFTPEKQTALEHSVVADDLRATVRKYPRSEITGYLFIVKTTP
jgi:hypothetical protein